MDGKAFSAACTWRAEAPEGRPLVVEVTPVIGLVKDRANAPGKPPTVTVWTSGTAGLPWPWI
jgi:hypothetical protein